jgi:hypothetical protein
MLRTVSGRVISVTGVPAMAKSPMAASDGGKAMDDMLVPARMKCGRVAASKLCRPWSGSPL